MFRYTVSPIIQKKKKKSFYFLVSFKKKSDIDESIIKMEPEWRLFRLTDCQSRNR